MSETTSFFSLSGLVSIRSGAFRLKWCNDGIRTLVVLSDAGLSGLIGGGSFCLRWYNDDSSTLVVLWDIVSNDPTDGGTPSKLLSAVWGLEEDLSFVGISCARMGALATLFKLRECTLLEGGPCNSCPVMLNTSSFSDAGRSSPFRISESRLPTSDSWGPWPVGPWATNLEETVDLATTLGSDVDVEPSSSVGLYGDVETTDDRSE